MCKMILFDSIRAETKWGFVAMWKVNVDVRNDRKSMETVWYFFAIPCVNSVIYTYEKRVVHQSIKRNSFAAVNS